MNPQAPSIKGTDAKLCQWAFKEMAIAIAGRDAGRYHNVVAAGLRARHVHLYESALVLELLPFIPLL
jgi:hypothetical protein